jgi:two-component system NtrC family sensor kinase
LNYYLPCRVASEGGGTRTIAVIGLGRTDRRGFLSSEDVELLGSLARYIGIAIAECQPLPAAGSRRSGSSSG